MAETRINNHAAFIWSVPDLLRGDYKQSEYGKVILPLTVLRRLDCVLEPTKPAVLARAAKPAGQVDNVEPVLCAVAGQRFYNTSPLDFPRRCSGWPRRGRLLRCWPGCWRRFRLPRRLRPAHHHHRLRRILPGLPCAACSADLASPTH